MSKQTSKPANRRPFLYSSAGLIGGIGLLSTGFLWNQAVAETLVIPDAAPAPAHEAPAIAPAAPPAPARIAPAASAPAPVSRRASAPAGELSAPRISVPAPRRAATLRTVTEDVPTIPPLATQGQNSFIDTTSYSQPAPQRLAPPTKVILTERSSGCQAVSQNGQLTGGNCGAIAPRRFALANVKPLPPPALSPRELARSRQPPTFNPLPSSIARCLKKRSRSIPSAARPLATKSSASSPLPAEGSPLP